MDVIISSLCCDVCPSLCSVPWCVSPQQCSKELCPADASCDPCSCGELPREGVHHSLPSWHAAAPTAAPCIREQAKIRFVKWHFINFLARFCKQHKKLTLGKFRDKFGCVFVQLGLGESCDGLCVSLCSQGRDYSQMCTHTHSHLLQGHIRALLSALIQGCPCSHCCCPQEDRGAGCGDCGHLFTSGNQIQCSGRFGAESCLQ